MFKFNTENKVKKNYNVILNLISVLAETFYPGFITFYAYAPCIYIMDFYGLLLIFFYAALVNTTHGFLLEMGCSTFSLISNECSTFCISHCGVHILVSLFDI
jgi:predicted CDP-diglyceride synthetase/phosphatidate cytidylyltransferase